MSAWLKAMGDAGGYDGAINDLATVSGAEPEPNPNPYECVSEAVAAEQPREAP